MLARLEVGLADEGVRVVHAVPKAIAGADPVGLYSRVVGYDDDGFPIPMTVRARRLMEALEEQANDGDEGRIDLVHAMAPRTWALALEVAKRLGAAAALEVWDAGVVGRASDLASSESGPSLMVGDDALLRLVGRRAPVTRTHFAPWGVHGESITRRALTEDRAIGLTILVEGARTPWLESALTGLAVCCRRDARVMVFLNGERAHAHAAWKIVQKLSLADRVSIIPDAEARREAILGLDGLLIAEPGGKLRSIALDAMACGLPVIAAADPSIGVLIDGVTAALVSHPESQRWESAIASLLAGDERIERLRQSAMAWATEKRTASGHVHAVLRAYEAIVAEQAPRRETTVST